MKKDSLSFRNPGTYTSPGTPDYADNNVGEFQRGWCSERVALPVNNSKRHISAAALIPFSSGRALPSKWDDAERWITSPLSGASAPRTPVVQPQRQSKSKSGPLDAQGVAFSPRYSPAHVQVLKGGDSSGFMVASPLTTGVLVPDGLAIHYGGGIGVQANPFRPGRSLRKSYNAASQTDLLCDSSLPNSSDEKHDGSKESEIIVNGAVSRRDMATQMSSAGGSPKERLSPDRPTLNPSCNFSSKVEIRDVQVDKGATLTRQPKEGRVRSTEKPLPETEESALPWDLAEASKNMSRLQREEARISAWENLQKAKAEDAINKLEMKLEKKRTTSMDKILNKLRIAQTRAHDMRELMTDNLDNQIPKSKVNKFSSLRKYVVLGSIGSCFRSHAD
ncbi:Terminase small subunit, Remorin [Heracleum sosnowskyi]|uniref:Terminase small subunit, Remorin n=1 Tax=Heracleum sosnowskyi TaxID=360622 RepID=A0AAD8MNL4_9APIA|nr:Terminase small subunit, Remorin [Heracleum sosnowskyi]